MRVDGPAKLVANTTGEGSQAEKPHKGESMSDARRNSAPRPPGGPTHPWPALPPSFAGRAPATPYQPLGPALGFVPGQLRVFDRSH